MSFACETEMDIQNELALRFAVVSKSIPMMEYVKSISSLIGASHILSVFEETDTIKVFFDDKRFMDALIMKGIHIKGHHVRVDYVIPPGTKVILSNVDPVVSNFDLTRLLSMYGSVVSPIICPPISDDIEFCHIGYGVRFCYMTINETIPARIEFKYGDQICVIKIKIGEEIPAIPFIKTDTDFTNNDVITPSNHASLESSDPIVVSVESAASDSISDLHLGVANLPIQRSIRRKRQSCKSLKIKRTTVTATTRAAKRIQKNVKHKWIVLNRAKELKKGKVGRRKPVRLLKKNATPAPVETVPLPRMKIATPLPTKSATPPPSFLSPSPTSSSDIDDILTPPLLITFNKCDANPLSEEKLLAFIDECKHNRAPLDLAKKYLGKDLNDGVIHRLIEQIENHSKKSSAPNLKLRLGRICKLLTESVIVKS